MKNEYGLDTDYFSKLIKREFGDISRFKPDEFARVCLRMAKTSDSNVINESEFASITDLQKENDELRASLNAANYHLECCIAYIDNLENSMERMDVSEAVFEDMPEVELDFKEACKHLESTPAQSLAEVKAQTVLEAANSLCIKGDSVKPVNYTMLVNYANQLKEG